MLTLGKKILLFLLLLIAGIWALIFINLNTISEHVIKTNLKRRGINQLDFKIKKISLHHLIIENLTWDKYCLKIQKINHNFSISKLLNHQYGELSAENINSCYTHQSANHNQTTPLTLPLVFPFLKNINFERIGIKNLKNTLHTGNTPLETTLDLEYVSHPNAKEINLQVRLMKNSVTADFTLKSFFSNQTEKIHIPYLKLQASDKIKIIAHNIQYSTAPNEKNFTFACNLDKLSFNHYTLKDILIINNIINLPNNQHQGKLTIKQMEDQKSGIRNLNLESTYNLDNQLISFNANIAPINKLFTLNILGKYDLDKKNGRLTLLIPPAKVDNITSIGFFFPISQPAELKSLIFNFDLKGKIEIKNNIAKPFLTLGLTDLSLAHNQINLQGVQTLLKLRSFSPPEISGEIKAPILDGPIPIRNFQTSFALHNNQIDLSRLSFSLWEGIFKLTPMVFTPLKKTLTSTELSFSSLDLAQVFAFLDKPNLKGTGKIGGKLPITFKHFLPLITDGHLYSEGSGNLKLQLTSETKQAMGKNQYINILTDYLDNLNYSKINLDLSTNDKLDIKSQIKIFGTNPMIQNKYQGRPLDFKMTLNFNIVKMLQSQGASLQLPEKIEKLFLKDGN
ncbi:MAG: hypothetical protein A2381_03955 [Bdellovibrionales bacterium RIFOXYB1_FULL_37_110]|nr:MAG: hypothetical protein A2417_10065 [Bdellovibrionales bacterium RIFOXYC1_FULL_37_79]OFZ59078.1 MAG: hypothetical protein A2381_03955 [Bdellovibrionales bacterium RIFOXYB1_FULL_37_110]OFZ64085.1 MAG: hypothetical protein A2577_15075 [Bdellovibrionales bacterium RIFOXYD1_FULL_36_51]